MRKAAGVQDIKKLLILKAIHLVDPDDNFRAPLTSSSPIQSFFGGGVIVYSP